jgi:hypothetical protein
LLTSKRKQREGILESIKNLLLVLSTQGVLIPPKDGAEVKNGDEASTNLNFWNPTWSHLDKLLPGLKEELFYPKPSPSLASKSVPLSKQSPKEKEEIKMEESVPAPTPEGTTTTTSA